MYEKNNRSIVSQRRPISAPYPKRPNPNPKTYIPRKSIRPSITSGSICCGDYCDLTIDNDGDLHVGTGYFHCSKNVPHLISFKSV